MPSDFNDMVNEAMGKTSAPEVETVPKKGRSSIEYMINEDGYTMELWPPKLLYRPVVGDSIESVAGRKLVVTEVIHKLDEEERPIVLLVLARDKGGQSETSGGGGAERDW